MYVLAKIDKLVLASSFSDDGVDEKKFCDTLTPTDKTEERAALTAYVGKLQAERKKRWDKRKPTIFSETNRIERPKQSPPDISATRRETTGRIASSKSGCPKRQQFPYPFLCGSNARRPAGISGS